MKNINKKEPKVWLEDINFDFDISNENPLGPHIHVVTNAASLHDKPLLLKSKESLLDEEKEILDKVNKKETVQKKDKGMDEQVLKDLNTKIDTLVAANEKAEKENQELKKQLKIDGIKKKLEDFNLENEDEVIKVLETIEDITEIVKAFSALKEFKEVDEENNELRKKLEKEAGADGDADPVEKSLNEQLKEKVEAAYTK